MFGPLVNSLAQLLQRQLGEMLRNPFLWRAALVAFMRSEAGRKTEEMIDDGIDRVVEFFSNIRIQITHRQKETQVVIDASTRVVCEARNATYSSIVQGANITINNINLHFLVKLEDIPHLEHLLLKFKELDDKCTSTPLRETINNVRIEYRALRSELVPILSNITDYEQLQKALGTFDQLNEAGYDN